MTTDGKSVLCRTSYQKSYVLSRFSFIGENIPIMVSNRLEIDNLLQEYTVHLNNYTLTVFEYTKEQEEKLLFRKLYGY